MHRIVVAFEAPHALARPRVPDTHREVVAARREELPIGRERRRPHGPRVTREVLAHVARLGVHEAKLPRAHAQRATTIARWDHPLALARFEYACGRRSVGGYAKKAVCVVDDHRAPGVAREDLAHRACVRSEGHGRGVLREEIAAQLAVFVGAPEVVLVGVEGETQAARRVTHDRPRSAREMRARREDHAVWSGLGVFGVRRPCERLAVGRERRSGVGGDARGLVAVRGRPEAGVLRGRRGDDGLPVARSLDAFGRAAERSEDARDLGRVEVEHEHVPVEGRDHRVPRRQRNCLHRVRPGPRAIERRPHGNVAPRAGRERVDLDEARGITPHEAVDHRGVVGEPEHREGRRGESVVGRPGALPACVVAHRATGVYGASLHRHTSQPAMRSISHTTGVRQRSDARGVQTDDVRALAPHAASTDAKRRGARDGMRR